ncbi:hypothetical protein HPB51_009783 [Rhipicephalus microplus]|uniref:glycylpeptide N-tetradecanoyltransferase n=1 Tax=Rhipicephalus microplus TaxID=6941 RepID=A0A9J6F0S8_RHIMP|nr:hypothetical protein HPB51_009783 [Rhipicephalus microplus]
MDDVSANLARSKELALRELSKDNIAIVYDDEKLSANTVNEPIERGKPIEEIRDQPYSLPSDFTWDTLDINNPTILKELYQLLNENYVEDDDNMFRFDYAPEFLKWALQPPGWTADWHCGVRVVKSNKLVGFISAVPATIRIYNQ